MITLGPTDPLWGNGLQTFRFGLKVEKQSPLPPNAICSFASKTYKHYLSYIMFSCNERPLARMCLCLLSCNGKNIHVVYNLRNTIFTPDPILFCNCKTEPPAFSESSLCRNVIWEAPKYIHATVTLDQSTSTSTSLLCLRHTTLQLLQNEYRDERQFLLPLKKEGLLKKEEGVFQNIWWQNLISRQIFLNIFLYNHLILFCSLHSCSHSREW